MSIIYIMSIFICSYLFPIDLLGLDLRDTSFPVSGAAGSAFPEGTPGTVLAQPANEIVAHATPAKNA